MFIADTAIAACLVACFISKSTFARISTACMLIIFVFVRFVCHSNVGPVEGFGNGDVVCKHVDNLDVDMPYSAHLRHFVFEDRGSLIDVTNCEHTTFDRVVDADKKEAKWQGPPSSTFLSSDSMSIFVTLDTEHELPLPGKETSIFVARAEPANHPSDNTSMALVQLGLACSHNGRLTLFGECGNTRVEVDYPPRVMSRVHFLTFTPRQVHVGFADVWIGLVKSASKNRGVGFKSTSSSPVVVNASSRPIGRILSVAVYDQSAHKFMDKAIQGISAHAMQRNATFADLLARYRTSLVHNDRGTNPPLG